MHPCAGAFAVAAVVGVVSAPAGAHVLTHLSDPRIAEASGAAVATREAGVLFTHNDSGDTARFFAVGATGRTLATYRVEGASAVDWEDMAAAPGPHGEHLLWFADIGDNAADRAFVEVYAVAEPAVPTGGRSLDAAVPLVAAYRLRYPDGPHDAETLLVDPIRHRLFVVTKSISGTSGVYAAPATPSASAPATMRRVATLHFSLTGTGGGPAGPFGELTATGGAVSADGREVVVRTYTDAYLWYVGPGGVAAALRGPPRARVPLPAQPQGEGVAFTRDGRGLVLTSEGVGSAVYAVALPRAPTATAPTATAWPGAVGRQGRPRPVATARDWRLPAAVAGGLLAVAGLGAAAVALRRRARHG